MPSRTRGGDAVHGANYGTNGSLSGFDDGFDLRPARITVKGAWLLAVSFGCHVELGYVPGSFTVSEAQVAIVDVRHLARPQFGRFTPVGLQLITSSWDIGSDGEYGSGPKAGRRANWHPVSWRQG